MIRQMTIDDYNEVYSLWMNTPGMGPGDIDDSRKGICKVALVVFAKNSTGNEFWEKRGFLVRDDLNYRNKAITEIKRMDT